MRDMDLVPNPRNRLVRTRYRGLPYRNVANGVRAAYRAYQAFNRARRTYKKYASTDTNTTPTKTDGDGFGPAVHGSSESNKSATKYIRKKRKYKKKKGKATFTKRVKRVVKKAGIRYRPGQVTYLHSGDVQISAGQWQSWGCITFMDKDELSQKLIPALDANFNLSGLSAAAGSTQGAYYRDPYKFKTKVYGYDLTIKCTDGIVDDDHHPLRVDLYYFVVKKNLDYDVAPSVYNLINLRMNENVPYDDSGSALGYPYANSTLTPWESEHVRKYLTILKQDTYMMKPGR